MSRLALVGLADDGIGPLTVEFEAGVHVVLGEGRVQLARLVELVTNVRKPRAGRVLVDGNGLDGPSQRRRLASLLVNEELVPARDVRSAVRAVLELRRLDADASGLLDRAGLSELADRDPQRLDESERHAVALVLALADTAVSAVVLHDPLGVSPLIAHDYVVEACAQRGRHAAVVVVTAQLEDAVTLGGNTWFFHRGRLVPSIALAGLRTGVELTVRSPEARRLAALLTEHHAVSAAAFDERHGVPELVVEGHDLEAVALAVVSSARAHSILIESMTPTLPALQRLVLEAIPEQNAARPQ